jgi:hypothetical protein
MKSLSETWFADGYIDFELKKYTLLAYLQEVNQCFHQNKLYPQLADVIFHYNNLLQFKSNKAYLSSQFPRRLSLVDLKKLSLLYEAMIADDDIMQELEGIMQYALAEMKTTIEGGADLYEFVEQHLEITPVGLIPIDVKEGYFFLRDGNYNGTMVYEYTVMFFEKHESKYRSMRTAFVNKWERSVANTVLQIKAELIKNRSSLPNPAVYAIETDLQYPVQETLLPVAKRVLSKYLAENTPTAPM